MSAIEVESIVAGLAAPSQAHEVLIDGQRQGSISGGQTRLFHVTPGIHTVRLTGSAYSSPVVKVVVGFGKTSVVCQTTARKLFGLFPGVTPNTQILVREEYETAPLAASKAASQIVWSMARDDAPMMLTPALAD